MSSRKTKSPAAGSKRRADGSPDRPLVPVPSAPLSASANKKQRQTEAIANKVQLVSSLPTPLLAAWLERLEGFKGAQIGTGEGDRQLMITWATRVAKKVPTYEEAVVMWRKKDPLSAAPPRLVFAPAGAAPSPEAAAQAEEKAADAAEGAGATAAHARRSLADEFASSDPPAAADTGADADDGLEPGQCSHCFCIAPGQRSNRFKCDECGLVSGKPEDSAVNAAIILKQTGGSTASGKSNKDDSAPAVPKLSAVDKELTRLAEEGEPFARFDDMEPVSAETALHEIRESWCGRFFAHPSPALVKYIQSGKLKEPGFAVPRSSAAAEEARSREAQGHVVRLTGDGLTTGATIKFPPVANARALMDAFVGTIGPALFGRQRALLDWFMLVRTVLAIDARRGWDAANHYLTTVLADSVPDRKPFGVFQERIAEHGGPGAAAVTRQTVPRTGAPPDRKLLWIKTGKPAQVYSETVQINRPDWRQDHEPTPVHQFD